MSKSLTALALAASAAVCQAGCPFLAAQAAGNAPAPAPAHSSLTRRLAQEDAAVDAYYAALQEVDFDAVKADLRTLMHTSQEAWPADWQDVGGNYGPFFVRLAWHSSGSYRTSDGRGGVDGGRQRFNPEQSWEDNTNLDKARELLWPIKERYGAGLSWGDLIVLAGTTAIEDMGAPILGFCAGRIDDVDGSASAPLGPTQYQEELYPCEVNGNCSAPLGSIKVGLIYVDPVGHLGNPVPSLSVEDIRDVFGRMGMNDTETVALIGGGHAFGKTHAACPAGAGPNPYEDPENPWPGNCGTGKGNDTYTSGLEGPWTTSPTLWDNQYFHNLLDYTWEKHLGSGGNWQWRVSNTSAEQPLSPIMMMTTDLALLEDDLYLELVNRYADDLGYLEDQFKHAWYKLTTRDMGPVSRCFGDSVPPPQPFQFPLPDPLPEAQLADFDSVKQYLVDNILYVPNTNVLSMDAGGYGPLFVRLAFQCANTFRQTDYLGGTVLSLSLTVYTFIIIFDGN
jgi:catalase-peroxidase